MWSLVSKLLIFCRTHTELQNFYCVMTFRFTELFDCILEGCIEREVILKREEGSATNKVREVEKVVCWVAPVFFFVFFFLWSWWSAERWDTIKYLRIQKGDYGQVNDSSGITGMTTIYYDLTHTSFFSQVILGMSVVNMIWF